MATIIPNFLTPKVISNLDTYNYTIQSTGMHLIAASLSINPPSGISIVIQQNSSTKATSTAPSATQSVLNLSTTLNCTQGDVISIIVSSSTPSDEGLNAFKGILDIHVGSSN